MAKIRQEKYFKGISVLTNVKSKENFVDFYEDWKYQKYLSSRYLAAIKYSNDT